MKKTILILSILFTTLISCNKDKEEIFTPTLPPITQTGANTFGCYIDSKLLIPRDGEGTFNSPSHGASYFVSGDYPLDYKSSLSIFDFKSGKGGFLQLNIENVQNGVGEFVINESNCQEWVGGNPPPTINLICRWKDKDTQELKYYCSIDTGILNILKYDRTNGILSGTFNCSAVNNDDSSDIIEITEGRFDIIWGTINDKEFP